MSKLGKRILLYIFSTTIALGLLFTAILYFNTGTTVNKTIGSQAMHTASNLALQLDGEKYKEINETQTESALYKELCEELNELREINGVLYAYTFAVPNEGEHPMFLVDGMPLDASPEDVAIMGSISEENEYSIFEKVIAGGSNHTK